MLHKSVAFIDKLKLAFEGHDYRCRPTFFSFKVLDKYMHIMMEALDLKQP